MPMRPRSGRALAYRQKKLWSSSWAEGCLKTVDLASLGIDARHHMLIVLSFPAASMACRMMRIDP